MASTTSTTRTPSRVESTDGTIRVYMPGAADDFARSEVRRFAQREHGNVGVGKTPAPVKAQRGHTWTFTPSTPSGTMRRQPAPKAPEVGSYVITSPAVPVDAPKASKARKASKAPKGQAPEVAALLAQLAALGVTLPGLEVPAPKASKAPRRDVPDFVTRPKTATCRYVKGQPYSGCNDLGVVRGASYLSKEGQPFKTANGRDSAHGDVVTCPVCKGKNRTA